MLKNYFTLLLRLVLGGVLVYAGYSKMIDMEGMAQAIENYRILPVSIVNIVAIILPPVEFIAGLCLIFGFLLDGALMITLMLFAVFCVAIESAIWRGLDIECGCALTSDAEIVGIKVLLRDLFFLLLTIVVWINRWHVFQLDSFFPWRKEKPRTYRDESSSSSDI